MVYKFQKSKPRWINFENHHGEKGMGGTANNGAKGHAFEDFHMDERKVLCDFEGSGIIRRIWITLSNQSDEVLQNVFLDMYWDGAEEPQVHAPLGDFFCMGLGKMRSFENHFFSTAEGRSFCCTIPMPFKKKATIILHNCSQKYINALFYDINLTLEELCDEDMHFYAYFHDGLNTLEKMLKFCLQFADAAGFWAQILPSFPMQKTTRIFGGARVK